MSAPSSSYPSPCPLPQWGRGRIGSLAPSRGRGELVVGSLAPSRGREELVVGSLAPSRGREELGIGSLAPVGGRGQGEGEIFCCGLTSHEPRGSAHSGGGRR